MRFVVIPQKYVADYNGPERIVSHVHNYTFKHERDDREYRNTDIKRIIRQGSAFVLNDSTTQDRLMDLGRTFGIRFSVHNQMTNDVIVIDRSGVPVTIKPEVVRDKRYVGKSAVIIRKEYHFDTLEVCDRVLANLGSMKDPHSKELQEISASLAANRPITGFGKSIAIEYVILESEILANTGQIYHKPSDLCLSMRPKENTKHHPCSPQNVTDALYYPTNYETGLGDLVVRFRYHTYAPNASPKYVRFGGKVLTMFPTQDAGPKLGTTKENKHGVEEVDLDEYIECIHLSRDEDNDNSDSFYIVERYSLELAREKFGVFNTLEEVNHSGIVAEEKQRDLNNKIAVMELEKIARLREINQLKDTITAKERETADLKAENAAQADEIKNKRDDEMHSRKMSYEFVKFILGAASAIITMIPIILKMKKATAT